MCCRNALTKNIFEKNSNSIFFFTFWKNIFRFAVHAKSWKYSWVNNAKTKKKYNYKEFKWIFFSIEKNKTKYMQDYNKSVFYFLLLLIIIFFCYVLLNIHLKCSIYNIYYYLEKKQGEQEKKRKRKPNHYSYHWL